MPAIISIGEAVPPNILGQKDVMNFARDLFGTSFRDIDRLLSAFQNGQVKKRHFVKTMEWYQKEHTFEEKNDTYIHSAIELGIQAIQECLSNESFLQRKVLHKDIDAIYFISSTGIATPTIEARIMNILPFSQHTKRIPIWGLGCAGGAAGLSRAFEYCRAYPTAKVLVVALELCSLTFQRDDHSKSNLIGTSLFADGVACALIAGDEGNIKDISNMNPIPKLIATQSTLMPDSLDVMGWDIKQSGLFVIFSKDIPSIVETWLRENVMEFLRKYDLSLEQINQFIAHPGGMKVLEAYIHSLQLPSHMIQESLEVLTNYGNMSSATILFVLNRMMKKGKVNEWGLCTALGPGFSSELVLLRWE